MTRRALAICVSFIAGGAATAVAGWAGLADLAPRPGEASRLCLATRWPAPLQLQLTTWHTPTTTAADAASCEATP